MLFKNQNSKRPKQRVTYNTRPNSRFKRRLTNIALTLIVIAGIGAIFHPYILSYIASVTLKPSTKVLPKSQRHKASYNAGDVRSITPEDLANAYKYRDTIDRVGQIVAPKIDLNMPIQPGVDYFTELMGAGEQYPRSEVAPGGRGNYVLASHHLESFWNTSALFTRIDELSKGDVVYVNDGSNVYTYQVTVSQQVSVSDTAWIDKQPSTKDAKQLTLYTCVSLATVDTLRYIVRANLTDTTPISDNMPKAITEAFNAPSVSLWLP